MSLRPNLESESVAFVHGHDDVAEPRTSTPTTPSDERFAVVIDSHSPESADAVFKFDLYRAIVLDALDAIGATRLSAVFDDGTKCDGVAAVIASISALPNEDREPPRMIEAFFGGALTAVVETEDWVHFGGPEPYHDSYTFVFYAQRELIERFAAACRQNARDNGIDVNEVFGRRS